MNEDPCSFALSQEEVGRAGQSMWLESFAGDMVQKQTMTRDRKEADLELVYMED